MQNIITSLDKIKLVGISVRTKNILEASSSTAKIGQTLQRYFAQALAEKIQARKNPGTTFCVYTNYESDHAGSYTYFVGEEVMSFEDVCKDFETLVIPTQTYTKFSITGAMPKVCIDAWKSIWGMTPADFGGARTYVADFEVYPHGFSTPENTSLNIYVGIHESPTYIREINISPLIKALAKFEKFRLHDTGEQERTGTIKAFEYCFEIAWKTMKRLLEERGKVTNSPKEAFRMAALEGFIRDPEIWFDFLKKRNLTAHSYNEAEAREILSVSDDFASEMRAFLSYIQQ